MKLEISSSVSKAEPSSSQVSSTSTCSAYCLKRCDESYPTDVITARDCKIKACLCTEKQIITKNPQYEIKKENPKGIFDYLIDAIVIVSLLALILSIVVIGVTIMTMQKKDKVEPSEDADQRSNEEKLYDSGNSHYELMTTEIEDHECDIRDF
jgi:hypothetical protein